MNLLKVLTLVGLAVFLSLLVTATARATDHPWDDNSSDSGRVQGQIHNIVTDDSTAVPRPFIDTPIIDRLSDWARGILRDVKEIFVPENKQVNKRTVTDPSKRPGEPAVKRKTK